MPYRDDAGADCPRCGRPLGGGLLDGDARLACVACGGRFLGFSSLPPGLMDWVATRPTQLMPNALRCPRCAAAMRAVQLAAHGRSVILDFCPGHGVWFDSNELELLARSLKAG